MQARKPEHRPQPHVELVLRERFEVRIRLPIAPRLPLFVVLPIVLRAIPGRLLHPALQPPLSHLDGVNHAMVQPLRKEKVCQCPKVVDGEASERARVRDGVWNDCPVVIVGGLEGGDAGVDFAYGAAEDDDLVDDWHIEGCDLQNVGVAFESLLEGRSLSDEQMRRAALRRLTSLLLPT